MLARAIVNRFRRGVKLMENNNGTKKNKRVEAVFKIIEKVAEKKAEALCIGLLYEPEVPKKLKRK